MTQKAEVFRLTAYSKFQPGEVQKLPPSVPPYQGGMKGGCTS